MPDRRHAVYGHRRYHRGWVGRALPMLRRGGLTSHELNARGWVTVVTLGGAMGYVVSRIGGFPALSGSAAGIGSLWLCLLLDDRVKRYRGRRRDRE